MMLRQPLYHLVMAAWLLSELFLLLRRRARDGSRLRDRGSLAAIWWGAGAGVAAALVAAILSPPSLRLSSDAACAGLALVAAGVALRWWAVAVLGRFFTINVAVSATQRLVTSGPFRFVRHPSYSGLLLAFTGLGLTFDSWLSPLLLLAFFFPALRYRIAVEEEALEERFGADYARYRSRTGALLPRFSRR